MIIVQLNIMTSDIDMNNNNFKFMNILQLKWILYNLIQKSNYKIIYQIIINLIIKIYTYV